MSWCVRPSRRRGCVPGRSVPAAPRFAQVLVAEPSGVLEGLAHGGDLERLRLKKVVVRAITSPQATLNAMKDRAGRFRGGRCHHNRSGQAGGADGNHVHCYGPASLSPATVRLTAAGKQAISVDWIGPKRDQTDAECTGKALGEGTIAVRPIFDREAAGSFGSRCRTGPASTRCRACRRPRLWPTICASRRSWRRRGCCRRARACDVVPG
jgi:hypothetical protein